MDEQRIFDELRAMRAETKADIKDVKSETINGTMRVEASVNAIRSDFQAHEVESATRNQEVSDRARAAHYRIDEMQKGGSASKAMTWQVWLGIGTVVLGVVLAAWLGSN